MFTIASTKKTTGKSGNVTIFLATDLKRVVHVHKFAIGSKKKNILNFWVNASSASAFNFTVEWNFLVSLSKTAATAALLSSPSFFVTFSFHCNLTAFDLLHYLHEFFYALLVLLFFFRCSQSLQFKCNWVRKITFVMHFF